MEVARFAPSPSGRMHLGNLFSALIAWLSAKSEGGKIILRIENLDAARCKPQYAQQLIADLNTLGLIYDEGAGLSDKAGEISKFNTHAPYYQSECGDIYQAALDVISTRARVYPCFCTRAELHSASAPHRGDGTAIYSGKCRALTPQQLAEKANTRHALRIEVPDETITFTDGNLGEYKENLKRSCGDFILKRSDGAFAYQLAVVVDDARMGVTQVVRGSDLLSSTARQIYLYNLLEKTPPKFYHIPLLCAPDGRRLSKRDGDLSLDALLQKYTPEEIIGKLARLANLQNDDTPCTPQSLVEAFDWGKIPKQNILIDPNKF